MQASNKHNFRSNFLTIYTETSFAVFFQTQSLRAIYFKVFIFFFCASFSSFVLLYYVCQFTRNACGNLGNLIFTSCKRRRKSKYNDLRKIIFLHCANVYSNEIPSALFFAVILQMNQLNFGGSVQL